MPWNFTVMAPQTSTSSSSYFSSSLTKSVNGQAPETTSYSERIRRDEGGNTTTERVSQRPGEEPVHERFQTDRRGHEVESTNVPNQRRIEDVSTKEEADRLYEERIEDEYAKREGGA